MVVDSDLSVELEAFAVYSESDVLESDLVIERLKLTVRHVGVEISKIIHGTERNFSFGEEIPITIGPFQHKRTFAKGHGCLEIERHLRNWFSDGIIGGQLDIRKLFVISNILKHRR
jgi:hypothetical protein